MKALKSTGLVPVEFLRSSGPYSKGQIAGLEPSKVKALKAAKDPVIKDARIPRDADTIDIDDDTLEVAVPTPTLGGYDHYPPLASNALPGRNRMEEPKTAAVGALEGPETVKATQDPKLARGSKAEAVEDGLVDTSPPAPPAEVAKKQAPEASAAAAPSAGAGSTLPKSSDAKK